MKYSVLVLPIALYAAFKLNGLYNNSAAKPSSLQLPRKMRVVTLQKVSFPEVAQLQASPAKAQTVSSATALIKTERETLYSQNINWAEHEAVLKEEIRKLSAKDISELGQSVIDRSGDRDERTIAAYLLSLAGPRAMATLAGIARISVPDTDKALDPHSVAAHDRDFETAVRVSALTALDALAPGAPEEIREQMQDILASQPSPTLRNIAQISLIGIQQGRPGKWARFQETF